MEFKEVNNALFQAKIIKAHHPEGSIYTGADCVCRIPVHCVYNGFDDTWVYKLLPGYRIVQPDRIKIETTDWFAYLFYDNLYVGDFSTFNQVTIDDALTEGITIVSHRQELACWAHEESEYWQCALYATGMSDIIELERWTNPYPWYRKLFANGEPELYGDEFWYEDKYRRIVDKRFVQKKKMTEDFIEENY